MIRPAIYDPVTAVPLGSVEFQIEINVNNSISSGGDTTTRVLISTVTKEFVRGAIPFVNSDAYWVFPDGEFACWRVWPKFIRTVDGINPDPNGDQVVPAPAGCYPNGLTWFGNVTTFRPDDIAQDNGGPGNAFPFPPGGIGGIFKEFPSELSILQTYTPVSGPVVTTEYPLGNIRVGVSRVADADNFLRSYCEFDAEGPRIELDPVSVAQDTLRTVPGGLINFGGTKTVSLPLFGATGTNDWKLTVIAS